jgi:hypothetical protein
MSQLSPIGNLELEPLSEGWEAVGVVALIKCRDSNGNESWSFRTSEELSDEETLGALVVRTELARDWLVDAYSLIDEA